MEAERPKRGLLHQRRGQESGNAAVVADDRKGGDGSWGVRSRTRALWIERMGERRTSQH